MLVNGEVVLRADPGALDGRLHRLHRRPVQSPRAGEDARRKELGFCKCRESQNNVQGWSKKWSLGCVITQESSRNLQDPPSCWRDSETNFNGSISHLRRTRRNLKREACCTAPARPSCRNRCPPPSISARLQKKELGSQLVLHNGIYLIQETAKRWALGCVNLRPE